MLHLLTFIGCTLCHLVMIVSHFILGKICSNCGQHLQLNRGRKIMKESTVTNIFANLNCPVKR